MNKWQKYTHIAPENKGSFDMKNWKLIFFGGAQSTNLLYSLYILA
jgi:hypothetical protein